MLSITCPYITEHLYLKMKEEYKLKEDSIYMFEWPKPDAKKIDKKLEKKFDVILQVVEKGLASRDKLKIGLKWPLAKAKISGVDFKIKEFEEILKNQLNVKEIKLEKSKKFEVTFDSAVTPALEAEGYARELSRQIQAFRKKLGLQKKDKVETFIITDENFKKVLGKQKKFIEKKTNSKKLEIVTTGKERFKNRIDFKIKDKKGEIAVV